MKYKWRAYTQRAFPCTSTRINGNPTCRRFLYRWLSKNSSSGPEATSHFPTVQPPGPGKGCWWTFFTLEAAFSWQIEIAWVEWYQSCSHMALSAAVSLHSRGQMVLCGACADHWPDRQPWQLITVGPAPVPVNNVQLKSIVSEGGHMWLRRNFIFDALKFYGIFLIFSYIKDSNITVDINPLLKQPVLQRAPAAARADLYNTYGNQCVALLCWK